MKKVLMPILLLVACSWFSSCNLDDDSPNFYFTTLNVVEADVPESFEFGETYDIDVTYLRPNGCTRRRHPDSFGVVVDPMKLLDGVLEMVPVLSGIPWSFSTVSSGWYRCRRAFTGATLRIPRDGAGFVGDPRDLLTGAFGVVLVSLRIP